MWAVQSCSIISIHLENIKTPQFWSVKSVQVWKWVICAGVKAATKRGNFNCRLIGSLSAKVFI